MSQPQPLALKPHILVVDDDDRLRSLLRRYLAEQDFIVTTASSADDARAKLKSLSYDLMVLDIMMPGETGLELTQSLRNTSKSPAKQLPILLLTARGESGDRIEGFEVGADDYLPKPFEPRELLLRINAILRRMPKPPLTLPKLKLGAWQYDPQRDELQSDSETVRLTDMEAGLMRVLAAEPGVAFSREALAERSKGAISDRTVDVQVTRLRRKIEPDVKNPRYLVTVRGEGYMLMPDIG
ncbi:MAG: response regulator transcription factor [Alphaproteobacteria bacterium]|nr:response regulator transcription factor [Alphaproteobacteria bacterium]